MSYQYSRGGGGGMGLANRGRAFGQQQQGGGGYQDQEPQSAKPSNGENKPGSWLDTKPHHWKRLSDGTPHPDFRCLMGCGCDPYKDSIMVVCDPTRGIPPFKGSSQLPAQGTTQVANQ